MIRSWRLLLDGAAPGEWNMAVDEVLLATVQQGGAPTLRIYRWEGAWLSLGFGQRVSRARLRACREAGVGVLRRVTGGGAVLHGADLTYAVAAPEDALPPGLLGSYEAVARGLEAGLAALGVEVERGAGGGRRARPFDCFVDRGADALCARGRKLCGSAQRRSRGGVLQHGSLRLAPDPEPARRAAGVAPEACTSLAELGVAVDPGELAAALARGIAVALGADLRPGGLGPAERRVVATGRRPLLQASDATAQ